MIAERITTMIERCLRAEAQFPPTEIYNEGWMLRLCLDWFGSLREAPDGAPLPAGANWYSEALLPSAFLPRYQGDRHAEGHTHADAVLGDFTIGGSGRAELVLEPDASRFVVIEAKMYSGLSPRTTHAPDYDQAARTVACMAEVLRRAGRRPEAVEDLAFLLVAPRAQIDSGIFGDRVTHISIEQKVRRRVDEYDEDTSAWYDGWFAPLLAHVRLAVISWEEVLETIAAADAQMGAEFEAFYRACVRWNGKGPMLNTGGEE
jgi:hypothetical protein